MMLNLKISLFFVILMFGMGCSDTGTRPSTESDTTSSLSVTAQNVEVEKGEPSEMDNTNDDYDPSMSLDDLNRDGIADSVFLEVNPETGSARISVFFGKGDGQYELFRMYELENFSEEFIPNLHGDTLSFCAYGTCYSFKFRDNDFYLAEYAFLDVCCPNYRLDFDKQKMTFILSFEDGVKSGTYYRSIDIPKNRVPSSYTILDCFKKDWGYTNYEDSFLRPKIDSFVKIINCELIGPNFEIIDNDTLYAYKKVVGRHELSMRFDKKDISKNLQLALESELSAFMSKEFCPYSNILLVFDERRKEWEEYNESNDEASFLNCDSYRAEKICSYEDFVTYSIANEHIEYENDRVHFDGICLTFDKNSGDYFCASMLKKEKALHGLLVNELKKYFGVESEGELMERLYESSSKMKKMEDIPFPKSNPYLCNDSLFFRYHDQSGMMIFDVGIPMKKALPYLTETGKAFLKIEK